MNFGDVVAIDFGTPIGSEAGFERRRLRWVSTCFTSFAHPTSKPCVRRIEHDDVETDARDWRLAHVEQSIAAREWHQHAADIVIDTTHLTPQDVAQLILDDMQNRHGEQ